MWYTHSLIHTWLFHASKIAEEIPCQLHFPDFPNVIILVSINKLDNIWSLVNSFWLFKMLFSFSALLFNDLFCSQTHWIRIAVCLRFSRKRFQLTECNESQAVKTKSQESKTAHIFNRPNKKKRRRKIYQPSVNWSKWWTYRKWNIITVLCDFNKKFVMQDIVSCAKTQIPNFNSIIYWN